MQYQIMHKDQVIAYADDDRITEIVNKELCPHCFVIGMPLTRWLDDRMIDTHRSHSRRLFKALRLRPGADVDDLIAVGHGITITDNWWVERKDESLDYRSLKQYNQEIADFAQFGALDVQNNEITDHPKFHMDSRSAQAELFSSEASQKRAFEHTDPFRSNSPKKTLIPPKANISPNAKISGSEILNFNDENSFLHLGNKPDESNPDSQQTDVSLFSGTAVQRGDLSGYRELGTVGSFEKAWRWQSGAWYMYKQGNTMELISEYYAFKFLKKMNVNAAEYFIRRSYSPNTGLETLCIVTKDFTNNAEVDFEPFSNYFYDHEEPDYILERMPQEYHKDYVLMLFYDVLLFNVDRHNQNVGFLRNSETGALIGLAPCFDYNIALAAAMEQPHIDPETGNTLSEIVMSNEICRRILRDNLPERTQIEQAVKFATAEAKLAFSKEHFRYEPYENYILQAYDYFASHLK